MRVRSKITFAAIAALISTPIAVNAGIWGLLAGYRMAYFAGAMLIPLLPAIGAIRFYQEHKEESSAT